MSTRPLLPFILQAVTIGIAAALLALLLLSAEPRRPVEIIQAAPHSSDRVQPPKLTSFRDAVQRASPAVVNIHTTKRIANGALYDHPVLNQLFNQPNDSIESSLGSGVVISQQGYILTNNHVIQDASDIQVMFSDGSIQRAELIGNDPETDLAVLKIKGESFPTITIGNSDEMQVGDMVLAIGNPFGVGQTVTMGIVSATGRDRLGLSTFEDFIQTDAAINPGNSGGALINPHGELVGINTAIFSKSGGSQGIGFAIPSHLAQSVLVQIIEHGKVIRGWLGVAARDLPLPASQSPSNHNGVLLTGIYRNSPAYRAGLEAGDIITTLNGYPIQDAYTLLESTARLTPGAKVEIHGQRGTTPFKAYATLIQRPPIENR